eukprot:Sspe_Gene.78646::Locus_49211_Transcript_3_3_Confidence_0.600_Length_594::g.78646::m.78646
MSLEGRKRKGRGQKATAPSPGPHMLKATRPAAAHDILTHTYESGGIGGMGPVFGICSSTLRCGGDLGNWPIKEKLMRYEREDLGEHPGDIPVVIFCNHPRAPSEATKAFFWAV